MAPVFKWLMILITISLLNIVKQEDIVCDIVKEDEPDNLGSHVRCTGKFQEAKLLQKNLANITSPIEIFEIYNSSLDFLPADIFHDVKNAFIRRFMLTESYLNLFSLPESNTSPFNSIENTLESFEIYDSSFAFAWNFSVLSPLSDLQSVILENSDVLLVENTLNPNIRFIQMINCKIRWIHKEAFQKNTNLSICSLSNNRIKTVGRSMFPQPALHLWSLDLSYNKLESLPKDMFEDMINLKELKLDYNRLEGQGAVYKIVWNHLTQLWLDGNDMICWTLCPVVKGNEREKGDRPLFFNSSKCRMPPKSKVLLDSFNC